MKVKLNNTLVYDSEDSTFDSEDPEADRLLDFKAKTRTGDALNAHRMKGGVTLGYNRCIFSLNKMTVKPIKLSAPVHEIKKIAIALDTSSKEDVLSGSVLQMLRRMSCFETPLNLRQWNPKCAHSVQCDDAVERAIDTVPKFRKVIEFCSY
mmetsp:Transcript_1676/g.3339  ORF Transcript_1676/g.3339 Transcript_1676/m.3339 type:complete len:151 (-) Transcript_1676:369-821(-)